MCFSGRCQPRGRTSSVAVSSFSSYDLSPDSKASVPSIASLRLICPWIMLCQVGEFESSKSVMNPSAPELSALITIFASVGPVISTRRRRRSGGGGATCHSPSRISRVSARKSSVPPSSSLRWRSSRAASSSRRRPSKRRCSSATKATAPSLRTSSKPSSIAPVISTPLTVVAISRPFDRPVQKLHGVQHRHPVAEPLRMRGYLDRAARVRSHDGLGAGAEQVARLAPAEVGGGVGLHGVVDARRAAADLPLRRLHDVHPGYRRQQLARLRADALRVGEVTGVVVGHPHRKRR